MEKRVNKTKEQLKLEVEQQKDKAFLEEYKALVEPIQDKHGRRLVPIIQFSQTGIQPVFAIDRYKKIEVQPANKNEKREEPKTD